MAPNSTYGFASMLATVFSLICLSLAMSQPLARVADSYDLHLFPEDDAVWYHPSELHKHSQNLHIATAFFLSLTLFTFFMDSVPRRPVWVPFARTCSSWIAAILYISALSTLGVVVKHVKEYLDDFPIPLPDIQVDSASGSTWNAVGLISSVMAAVLSCVHMVAGSDNDGYSALA